MISSGTVLVDASGRRRPQPVPTVFGRSGATPSASVISARIAWCPNPGSSVFSAWTYGSRMASLLRWLRQYMGARGPLGSPLGVGGGSPRPGRPGTASRRGAGAAGRGPRFRAGGCRTAPAGPGRRSGPGRRPQWGRSPRTASAAVRPPLRGESRRQRRRGPLGDVGAFRRRRPAAPVGDAGHGQHQAALVSPPHVAVARARPRLVTRAAGPLGRMSPQALMTHRRGAARTTSGPSAPNTSASATTSARPDQLRAGDAGRTAAAPWSTTSTRTTCLRSGRSPSLAAGKS